MSKHLASHAHLPGACVLRVCCECSNATEKVIPGQHPLAAYLLFSVLRALGPARPHGSPLPVLYRLPAQCYHVTGIDLRGQKHDV